MHYPLLRDGYFAYIVLFFLWIGLLGMTRNCFLGGVYLFNEFLLVLAILSQSKHNDEQGL